jgi:hypothetical protein
MAGRGSIIVTDISGINNLLIDNKEALLLKTKIEQLPIESNLEKLIVKKNSFKKLVDYYSYVTSFKKHQNLLSKYENFTRNKWFRFRWC